MNLRIKEYCILLIILFYGKLVSQTVSTGIPAAMKATSGVGLHKNRIWWINWDLNNNKLADDNLVNGATATFTSPAGFVYTLKISNVKVYSGSTQLTSGSNYVLGANSTTSWTGNNIPYAYSGFVNPTNGSAITPAVICTNNMLGTAGGGNRVTYTLTVTAKDPNGNIGNATGIVIGGAESLNGTNEYYSITTTQGQIRVMDKYIHNNAWGNFSTQLQVSNGGKTVRVTNPNTGDSRGDVMLFVEDVPSIDCEVKGGGGQSIAIGFLEELDYSDAPQSYGMAYHLYENKFSGGIFPVGNTNINTLSNAADLASPSGQLARFDDPTLRLGANIDSENNPVANLPLVGSASANPNWDDTHGDAITDEDALNVQTKITNNFLRVSYLNISPLTSYLNVWIDKDRNGKFDTYEKLTKVIPANKQGNAIFDLSSLNIPVGTNYYTRIRYSSDPNLGPTGYASNGEVEDHWIDVVNNKYNILGTIYLDSDANIPSGTVMYNVPVSLYDSSNNLVETIYSNHDGQYLFTGLANGTYTVKVSLPASNYQHISSTDSTPVDGITTVVVNNGNILGIDFGLYFNFCLKPANTSSTGLPTNHGITALGRAGSDNGNWPMIRKGAWTALESKTKGFVVNRVAANNEAPTGDGQIPSISQPVKGMMVYDTTNHCIKIYDGTKWQCYNTLTCPTVN